MLHSRHNRLSDGERRLLRDWRQLETLNELAGQSVTEAVNVITLELAADDRVCLAGGWR